MRPVFQRHRFSKPNRVRRGTGRHSRLGSKSLDFQTYFHYRTQDFPPICLTTKSHPAADDVQALEQVQKLEEQEQGRVEEAKKKYEQLTAEKLRQIEDDKNKTMDRLRQAKQTAWEGFEPTVMAESLDEAKKTAARDIAALDAHATKHRKKLEDDLEKKALDPAFYPAA